VDDERVRVKKQTVIGKRRGGNSAAYKIKR